VEHSHTDETSGTRTGRACPNYGLALGGDVDDTTLRRLAGEGAIADLTLGSPGRHRHPTRAGVPGRDRLLSGRGAGARRGAVGESPGHLSQAWSANYAALEFLQDTGLSRFSPVKPQRWLAASFEHHCGPHGLPHPHIHNIVVVALTKGA
jgi:hypothetical protein